MLLLIVGLVVAALVGLGGDDDTSGDSSAATGPERASPAW